MNRLIAISKRLIFDAVKAGKFFYRSFFTDAFSITDTVETQSEFNRDLADSVGMAATVDTLSDYVRDLSDNVGISDAASMDAGAVTSDLVGISDTAVPVSTFIRAVSDTMSITDTGYMLRQDYALDPTYFADDYVTGTKQTFD